MLLPVVKNGCSSATSSGSRINPAVHVDPPAEMRTWDKIETFFDPMIRPAALDCVRNIYHPPAGFTLESVVLIFGLLKMLADPGYKENIQSGRHGENHFCILDANSREILSVTLDDANRYTVECEGNTEVHDLTMVTQHGAECVEHTQGESENFRATNVTTTAPQTADDYEAVWSAWMRAAPPEERVDRATVVQELRDCQDRNDTLLNLSNLTISSLPTLLPQNIEDIQITRIPLTSLPALPESLTSLDIYKTQLSTLPALPLGLNDLDIHSTPLTSLPTLPDSLARLKVTGTLLTHLPELPSELDALLVRNTPLTSLPTLPSMLNWMEVHSTLMNSLPELPPGLNMLMIHDTPLNSLPELPPRLTRLLVVATSLTSLPESISRLPSNAEVTLSRNPLSERTLQALRDMTFASDYSGPRIRFDMAGPSAPQETRTLHLAAADWLAPAVEEESPSADRWQAFGQEDNAASFSRFLDRLSKTVNCKKHSDFKAQISSWLTQLAEDNELRAKTFAMATEATSSCEDRVTLALNQMKSVQLIYNAEKVKYDNHLSGLISMGREMFRLEKLEQIAQEKVKTLRFVDEIEVYLGYQNKLKNPLELTSVTEGMRFFDVSQITESDLQAAELQVKTAENSEFRDWILQWQPLHSVLKRAEPTRWEALCEKKISDYEDTYRTLSDTELKPQGLLGDTEAERTIGKRALDSAEKAFLDGLSPLVDKKLASYLEFRWPSAESPKTPYR